jgi:hypothetical protein
MGGTHDSGTRITLLGRLQRDQSDTRPELDYIPTSSPNDSFANETFPNLTVIGTQRAPARSCARTSGPPLPIVSLSTTRQDGWSGQPQ